MQYLKMNTMLSRGSIVFIIFIGVLLNGCFKDFEEENLFKEFMVELDDATWLSPASGKDYPILGPYEKGSGVQTFQVNLLGEKRNEATEVQYKIVAEETTAEENKHFELKDNGTFTIDADSTTGYLSIDILDFVPEAGTDTLVLELVASDDVQISENYKRIGIAISLVGPPSEDFPLHQQLGEGNYYNSLYFDIGNQQLPADVRDRFDQAAANLAAYGDGTRRFQALYMYFGEDETATVVAQYYGGGGNSLTAGPRATWTYEIEMDDSGVGKFVFLEANGNGNSQKSNFDPILGDFLEKYEFKIDWNDPSATPAPREGVSLGGLYRTDDPNSFLLGSLEDLNETGTIRPYPTSQILEEAFSDGNGGYYTTIFIDPDDANQSEIFQDRWADDKTYIEGLDGRQLHKAMLYFNPNFNFQDVRFVNFYYSSAGGKFLGQMRFTFHLNSDGTMDPWNFFYENGNGRVTHEPEIIDNFLMKNQFEIKRTGDRVKFIKVNNPDDYFEGELGNLPLGVNDFWP